MAERLQKVMSHSGVASRRASEKLILNGKVKVNGKVITKLGTKVNFNDIIEVDGKFINHLEDKKYYLFYKPRGVISSVIDNRGRKVVNDYFKDVNVRLYPVGRLDYDTSGLLLMTNDGDLANMLMHPKYNIEKKYIAKVKGIITSNTIQKLKLGLKIGDRFYSAPSKIRILSSNKEKNRSIISLCIHEGKYHQVKIMLKSVGYPVEKLKREKYAFLTLDGLLPGQYRSLSFNEIASLKKLVNINN